MEEDIPTLSVGGLTPSDTGSDYSGHSGWFNDLYSKGVCLSRWP